MNAKPLLTEILRALRSSRLETVMIGNAAAALYGAPVTTLDFDFMFQDTPRNRAKLKQFARLLDAVVLRPYYPVSALFRVVNDMSGIQVDLMPRIHGVKSFAILRSRATEMELEGVRFLVAALDDIIKSKSTAGRKSVYSVKRRNGSRKEALQALKRESKRQLRELIDRRIALPLDQRLNFLRVRLPGGGSAL